jgi:hypothetical protein
MRQAADVVLEQALNLMVRQAADVVLKRALDLLLRRVKDGGWHVLPLAIVDLLACKIVVYASGLRAAEDVGGRQTAGG